MKMGIIQSVLKAVFFFNKKLFSLSDLYLKDFLRFSPFIQILIPPIRAVLTNAVIKTGKTLALTVEGLFPLIRIARKSSCKFYTAIELAQALEQTTEM